MQEDAAKMLDTELKLAVQRRSQKANGSKAVAIPTHGTESE
jgi:hypothetical protein